MFFKKLKLLTHDPRLTTHDDRRRSMAIGQLKDTGDLKKGKPLSPVFKILMRGKGVGQFRNFYLPQIYV